MRDVALTATVPAQRGPRVAADRILDGRIERYQQARPALHPAFAPGAGARDATADLIR